MEKMSKLRCFFCMKHSNGSKRQFEYVDNCKMPASQKPLSVVLQHLANGINTKLEFGPEASMCKKCVKDIMEYDNLMVNLLACQKKLTNKLRATLEGKEEEGVMVLDNVRDFEEIEAMAEEIIDVHPIGDDITNPNSDTKEEYIEIDENVVLEEDVVEEFDHTYSDVNSHDDDDDSDSDSTRTKRGQQECMICGMIFKTKNLLLSHISEVHGTKSHICNICGITRKDEEYLELHMNIHEGKTEMECRYCPKTFSRPINTIRHMRKHWDKKKYQCEKCGERFSLDNMLYNHRLRHEAEENPLICSTCNQSFRSRKTFNHHLLIHSENRPRYHCSICSKSFTERYTLKMHLNRHNNGQLNSATYQHPPTTEDDAQGLIVQPDNKEIEEAVTSLVMVADNACVICSLKFENKALMQAHLQQDHDVILTNN